MTTVTIRPNATRENSGGYAAHIAASLAAAVNDNNASSYIWGVNGGSCTLECSSHTLLANERCLRAKMYFDGAKPDGPGTAASVGVVWRFGNFDDGVWTPNQAAVVGASGTFDGNAWANAYPDAAGSEWTQDKLDRIHTQVFSTIDPTTDKGAYFYEIYIDLDIRHTPTVVVNSDLNDDTHWPTIRWTPGNMDGQDQAYAQVHVFDLSVNASPDPTDTAGLVYTSATLAGGGTSRVVVNGNITGLKDGSYMAFVRVAKDFNGSAWWSDWDDHPLTIAVDVAVPTALTVIASTLNSNTPTLRATVAAPFIPGSGLYSTAKAEFQIASDAGFTTNVRQFIGPNTDLTRAGVVTDVVPAAQALTQGIWYYRARTVDSYGSTSDWCAAQTFTISHPPTATPATPTGGASLAYGDGTVTFAWTYFNSAGDDEQSAYEIVVVDADGVTIADTGKITSAASSGTALIPTSSKNIPLRWKVKVWDNDDVPSTFSAFSAFVVADAPVVVITAPVADGTVSTPSPEVDWTFSAAGGRTQASYRVSFSDSDGNLAYDTGWKNGAVFTNTPSTPVLLNNQSAYTLLVQVRDNTGLEGSDTFVISTAWIPPAGPDCTLDSQFYNDNGYVQIQWDDSVMDTDWYSWRVYRRPFGRLTWDFVLETTVNQSTYTGYDFLAASDVAYDYAVVQVAIRFNTQVESDREPVVESTTPSGDKYWLLIEADFSSIRFDLVNTDSYTDEFEAGELLVAGRGRHVDKGTRWGVRGELAAKLIDNDRATAQEANAAIAHAQSLESDCWLRTPFGQVWHVSVGDIATEREAGTGKMEVVTVTVPYVEIYE